MTGPRDRVLAVAVLAALLAWAPAVSAQPDPLLEQQWHLKGRDVEAAGANVRAAWPTTRGTGIVIGIVDDGVQTTHPDLQPAVNLPLSFDFVDNDPNPNPRIDPTGLGSCNPSLASGVIGDSCHGTAVAGVAGARGGNGIGVSGVAPSASLAGLRLLGPRQGEALPHPVSDDEEARAIGFRTDAIQVKNFSFGPADDGATLERPGPLTEAAIRAAVTQGRGGRGSVFVWAAGNGGLGDNCNFDGFANSRFVIATGAVGDDAQSAPYSEPCSALFVTAPSSGGFRGITTTDLVGVPGFDPDGGNYTDRFGGTSSAAPAVSGVVALMLAANPALTARDVKHILVRSSFRLVPDDPGWTPGPLPHHERLGFGLVDARAAVTAATTWVLVPPERTLADVTRVRGVTIPDNNAVGVSDTITITTPGTVEHVEVVFDATHPSRGDLEVFLRSPAGVVSHLATVRPADSGSDFVAWRFGSVRHWGESAGGTWTLTVADRGLGDVGTWNSWTLRIFGTENAPGIVASGRVTRDGGPFAGVTLTFTRVSGSGAIPGPVQTDSDGNWSQSGFVAGTTYRVTPSRAGFTFTPAPIEFSASRSDLSFVAAAGCAATPITLGQTVSGALATTDCPASQRTLAFGDRYTFAGIAGQQVAIAMTSAAFDTFAFLLDPNGAVVAFNDDSGGTLSSRIPSTNGFLTLPATGTYTIEATSFAAGATGAYTLALMGGSGLTASGHVTTGTVGLVGVTMTFARTDTTGTAPGTVVTDGAGNWSQVGFATGINYRVTPSRPGFTFSPASGNFSAPRTDLNFTATTTDCVPTAIALGQTISGGLATTDCNSVLRPGSYADRYTFTGTIAQQIAITLSSSAFDTFLFLQGPNGFIASNDDSGGTLDSRIPANTGLLTLPATGIYTIEVTSLRSFATGAYTLALTGTALTGFSAAGQVTTGGIGLSGVTVTFTQVGGTAGSVPGPVQTNNLGNWSQTGFIPGATYRVTPSRPGTTFAPVFRDFTNTTTAPSLAAQNFTAVTTCPATPIAIGQTVGSTLAATDCLATARAGAFADRYTFSLSTPQQVAIAMTSTAFDPFLFLFASNGTLLNFNDDSGGTLNSRIPVNTGFLNLAAGTYTIEATSYPPGVTGAYTLSLTSPSGFAISGRVIAGGNGLAGALMTFSRLGVTGNIPPAVLSDASGNWSQAGFTPGSLYRVIPSKAGLVFTPPAFDFSSGQGGVNFTGTAPVNCLTTPIAPGQTLIGALALTDCPASQRSFAFGDRYTFAGNQGQQVAITLTSAAFDTYLYLIGPNAAVVAVNDDSGGTFNSRIPVNTGFFTLPSDGTYTIEATSFAAGATGTYSLNLIVSSCTTAPTPISFNQTVNATLTAGCRSTQRPTSFTDRYAFTGTAGQPISIAMSSGFDTVLFLLGPSGLVAANDDSGGTFNSRIPANTGVLTLPATGQYVIEASTFAADTTGPYTLTLTLGCPSTPIALGQTIAGALAAGDCFSSQRAPAFGDRYSFTAAAGDFVAISMTSAAFDTVLYLLGPTGTVVAINDDSGGTLNSRIPVSTGFIQLPTTGIYTIEATSFSTSATGAYNVTLTRGCASAPIGAGQTLNGSLNGTDCASSQRPSFADRYTFSGTAGQQVSISMTSAAFDTFLYLIGPTGSVIGSNDNSGATTNSRIPASGSTLTLPTTGQYTIEATSTVAGATGAYAISLVAGCVPAPIAFGQTLAALAGTDCASTQRPFAFGDSYTFSGSAGQLISISMTSTFDTVLYLLGPNSFITANDDSGGTLNSRIPVNTGFLTLPFSGQYTIEATSFNGGALGSYALSLCAGTPIGVGQTLGGTLTSTDCRASNRPGSFADSYVFSGSAGQQIAIAMDSAFDTYLYLFGPSGLLVQNDDSGGTFNSRIPINSGVMTLPQTGQYVIEATSFAPTVVGSYTVRLATGSSAPFSASAALAGAGPAAAIWTPVGDGGASGSGISNDPTGVGAPAIAVDPVNGDIYVAWESGSSDIYVRRWNGAAWVEVGDGSASGGGISGNAGQSRHPSITLAQSGRPIVAWIDGSSSHWEIYVKRFDGTAWVPAGSASAAAGGGISNAGGDIASPDDGRPYLFAERGGNVFAAWATNAASDASQHRIVVATLPQFGDWQLLPSGIISPNVADPATEYQTPIYLGARAPAITTRLGTPVAVYLTGNTLAGTNADVHVRSFTPNVWSPFPGGVSAATNAGISDIPPRLPGYSLSSPRVAVGPTGVGPFAAWVYADAQGRLIQVRQLTTSAGGPPEWRRLGDAAASGDIFLPPGGTTFGGALSLTVGADNLPIVAWSSGGASIYVRKFSPVAGWHELGSGSSTGGGVSDSVGGATLPALAVDTHNNLNVPVVAWRDSSTGIAQIYVRRAGSHPDLVIDSVSAPISGGAGQPLDFAFTVRNRGGGAAGAFSVGVYLSTNNTIDKANDRLLATQQIQGLAPAPQGQQTISLRVTLPADVAPGRYFLGALADIDDAVDETDELNNGRVSENGIQVSGPDLRVTLVNGPSTATPGQPLVVEVTVKNEGQGRAASSRVGVYLSLDPAPRTGHLLGRVPVAVLPAGATQTVTPTFTVPANIDAGTYFLAAVADDEGQIAESNEDNNGLNSERLVDIVRPDLVVTEMLAPPAGAPGVPLVISSEIKNQAAAPPPVRNTFGKIAPPQLVVPGTSPSFRLNFHLSTDGAFHPGDPLLGGRDIAGLAPGSVSRGPSTLTVPGNVSAGTYFIVAVADVNDVVREQSEANNTRASTNSIEIRRPDLALTAVSGPASGLGATGRPLAVSVTVKNQALAPANAGAFRIGVYLSPEQTPGSGQFIGFIPVNTLNAGGLPVTVSGTVTVPGTLLDGLYFLSAVADYDNRIAESDETNNGFTSPNQVSIRRPDLVVTRLSGPATGQAGAGDSMAVTVAVKNQAPPPADAGAFLIGIYLSSDPVAGSGTLVGNVSVSRLAAGAADLSISANVVLPPTMAAGTYFLTAVADFDGRIAELDDSNNGFVGPQVSVRRPDLMISKLTGPAGNVGAAGQPLAVSIEAKNTGSDAGAFAIGLYLSTSNTPGPGTFIGSVRVARLVGGGAPITIPATVPVPADIAPGMYFLSAIADFDQRISESDEANNGRTADNQILISRPDLIVTSVAPTSPLTAVGQLLGVTGEVKNEAAAPAHAGAFRVGFYLATTPTPGAGTLVGSVNVAGLVAGARQALTASFRVPSNLSAGTYFLSAVADVLAQIPEANDANNGLASSQPIDVRRPDLFVVRASGPAIWATGQPFPVAAVVGNRAPAPAVAGSFRIGVYLSTTQDPGTGRLIGSAAVAGLAPATNSSTITVMGIIPADVAPGQYWMSVVAALDDRVAESDETNNGRTIANQVEIRRADLAVTAVAGRMSGRTLSVTSTVMNGGNAVVGTFRLRFFISPLDATPGAGLPIGSRDVTGLGPGQASTATTSIALPTNVPGGSYFVSAVADVAGTVAESDETNNGLTAAAQVLIVP